MTTEQIVALCLSTVAVIASLVSGYYCLRIRREIKTSRELAAKWSAHYPRDGKPHQVVTHVSPTGQRTWVDGIEVRDE